MAFFDYSLPQDRIAQRHKGNTSLRSDSRLLHASIGKGLVINDLKFLELSNILRAGDLLVLNNTRVMPVRFFPKELGEGCEVFLVSVNEVISSRKMIWSVIGRPMKKIIAKQSFKLCDEILLRVVSKDETGRSLIVELESLSGESLFDLILRNGLMPIPPYIRGGRSDNKDSEIYQTVFSSQNDLENLPQFSVAAPTAALHFTDEIFRALQAKEVDVRFLNLEVGLASMLSVDVEDARKNGLFYESYQVPKDTYQSIIQARKHGHRVISVGTTVVRALESFFLLKNKDEFVDTYLSTNIFIEPGFEFKVIDSLITNFHQPKSSHLYLVSALVGGTVLAQIYKHGLDNAYRFLSYGDSMFLDLQINGQ